LRTQIPENVQWNSRNVHVNVGTALNTIREAVIASLSQSDRGDLEATIPPLNFKGPKNESSESHKYYAVDPREAARLYGQLELILAHRPDLPSQAAAKTVSSEGNRKVFLVHGHDEAARETVARFVERLGLELVILHEQASQGRTVIEKLERHGNVSFAIVLLTPDDEGRKAGSHSLRPRARQNVVLELGYFIGRLGRSAVCALYKGDIEIPSDYLGVVFTPLDEGGGWRLSLAQEMKVAGLDVDLNKAF
jgi:predicted nucleotide-binding protein